MKTITVQAVVNPHSPREKWITEDRTFEAIEDQAIEVVQEGSVADKWYIRNGEKMRITGFTMRLDTKDE